MITTIEGRRRGFAPFHPFHGRRAQLLDAGMGRSNGIHFHGRYERNFPISETKRRYSFRFPRAWIENGLAILGSPPPLQITKPAPAGWKIGSVSLSSVMVMNNCRFALFLLALPFALAQKPVTLDAITSTRTRDTGGSITWTPDGKSFAYTEGKGLMLYDAATGKKSELANLEALEELAVQAKGKQPFDWENRRVREDQLQWAPDGRHFFTAIVEQTLRVSNEVNVYSSLSRYSSTMERWLRSALFLTTSLMCQFGCRVDLI